MSREGFRALFINFKAALRLSPVGLNVFLDGAAAAVKPPNCPRPRFVLGGAVHSDALAPSWF